MIVRPPVASFAYSYVRRCSMIVRPPVTKSTCVLIAYADNTNNTDLIRDRYDPCYSIGDRTI